MNPNQELLDIEQEIIFIHHHEGCGENFNRLVRRKEELIRKCNEDNEKELPFTD